MARILIIDDRPADRDLLVTILGYYDHVVFAAHSGIEGLTLALVEQPDLIITDIQMPGMDGYELARRIRADSDLFQTRLIFYTGAISLAELRQRAVDYRDVQILIKPAEPEVILALVNAALAGPPPSARPDADLERANLRLLASALRRNVEELRQTESDLRYQADLLAQVSDAIISTDLNFTIKSWNAAAKALYGWPAEDSIGKPMGEVVPTEYLHCDRQQAHALLLREGRWHGEIVQQRKDGAWLSVLSSVSLLKNEAGHPIGAVAVNRDISDRRRAERALRESEERFAKAFRASPAGLAISRASDSRFIDVNDAFLRLHGYTRAEIIEHSVGELNLFPYPAELAAITRLVRQKRKIHNHEMTIQTKSGEPRQVLFSTEAIEMNGEACFITLLVDISGRKQAEQSLQRSAERLRVLADASRAFAEAGTNYQALLDQIARMSGNELGAGCIIRLLSDDAQWLDTVAFYHQDPAAREVAHMLPGHVRMQVEDPNPYMMVLRTGEPLFIPLIDPQQVRASLSPELWSAVERFRPVTAIGAPLRLHGEIIGLFALTRYGAGQPPFDQDDLTLAQDLADRAALAIGNARLFQQAQAELAARERAQAELQESHHKLRLAIEAANIGLWDWDLRTDSLYYSPEWKRQIGYADDEIANDFGEWQRRVHPDDLHRMLTTIEAYLRDPWPHYEEVFRFQHKDGSYRWMLAQASILTGEDGKPYRMLGSHVDITERKRAQEAIERLAATLQEQAELLDHAHVLVRDLDSRIIFWNQGAELLYGWTAAEAIGEISHQLLRTHFPVSFEAYQADLVAHGVWEGELVHFRRDGIQIVVASHQVMHRGHDGAPTHILEVNNDITARRQAEEALRRRAQELAALNATVIEITTAHDLPALLQAIVERAVRLHEAHGGSLFLCDPERQEVRCVVSYRTPSDYTGSVFGYGQGAAGIVAQTAAPLIVDDYRTWRGRAALFEGQQPFSAVLSVPMLWQEVVTGVILIFRKPGMPLFTVADQELLAQLATHAAIAVENTRLLESERQARALAETLHAANLALTASLDLDTVLVALLEYLEQLVPYDSANVMLLEDDTRLVVAAMRGYERWTAPVQTRAITFDAATSPLFAELLAERQSVLIADTNQHPHWQRLAGVEHVQSWFGVPLVAGGALIGLYSVDKAEANFFTTAHVRLAEALAAQVAVAIQNARLFTEVLQSQAQLQTLSHRLVEVQEAERRQIARELHDEVGQVLTGLKLTLDMAARLPTVQVADRLGEARAVLNDLMARVRNLSLDLRPTMLDDMGLLPALEWHFDRYTSQTGIQVLCRHNGIDRRFPAEVETTVYRIVQEALTNVARYADVRQVSVLLLADQEWMRVRIDDQGRGFDLDHVRTKHISSGLTGMHERAVLLGGELTIESAPGVGTYLVAELPLAN
jgi:PAS domain S-box-containing protein